MLRAILLTAVIALTAMAYFQHQRLDELQSIVAQQDLHMVELKARQQDSQTAMALLYRFSLANHQNILGLKRKQNVTVTAYSPRPEETDDTPYRTASNRPVRSGIVAVSRDLFDAGWVFGKQVYIKNHGVFTIDDLMHPRKKNQIDIFMHETDRALRFGRKQLDAYLLENPAPPLSSSNEAEEGKDQRLADASEYAAP